MSEVRHIDPRGYVPPEPKHRIERPLTAAQKRQLIAKEASRRTGIELVPKKQIFDPPSAAYIKRRQEARKRRLKRELLAQKR